jgi:hypothetical protein
VRLRRAAGPGRVEGPDCAVSDKNKKKPCCST